MKRTNLRRNLFIGVLMGLVMVLGGQSSVEALTLSPKTSPSDLSTLTEGATITVSGIRGSLNDADVEEEVSITVSGGGTATFDPAAGPWTEETTTSVTSLTDGSGNGTITIPSSVEITIPDAGTVTVTVTWDNKDGSEDSKVFVFYVAPVHNDVSDITLTGTDITDGQDFEAGRVLISDDFVALTNVRVTYAVSGSGKLYISSGITGHDNEISVKDPYTTSSAAVVNLDMNGSTNIVTISVAGQRSDRAKSIIYIYSHATLTKQSGDKQRGAFSSRLAEPLVVKVVDGKKKAVSGVEINFVAEGGGSFVRNPNFPLNRYVPETDESITYGRIQTDSSGQAQVFWVLGASGDQTATATLTGTSTPFRQANQVEFTATGGTSTASSIVIESGDGQRANKYNLIENPLVVTVRDERGQLFINGNVEFLARDGGTLHPPEDDDPGTEATTAGYTGTSSRRVIATNSSGQASIRYTPPKGSARRTVSATILNTAQSVIFTINGAPSSSGGGDGGGGDPDPPTITRTLDIDVSGSGTTREVTVTALENGTERRDIFVRLSVDNSGATLSERSGGTPLTSTLRLPAGAGEYTLTASTTAGYSTATETITITVPGTLTISPISPTTGAQTVSVTARRGGSLQGDVNFTISGSGIVPARGVTTAAGSGNAILNFPRTGTYTLTVSADGYDNLTVSVRITTAGQQQQQQTQQTTTTTTTTTTGTAGTADSIEIDGDRQLSGTVNQALRLRVGVHDANDRGVSGVRVTFRVLAPGKGRLSQRGNGRAVIVETDRNGYATASLTPLGGDLIVEAKAARVSAAVTFIITVDGTAGDRGSATTDDTTAARTYNVGDKIPISPGDTLTFRGSRTLNGITYTCVGSGECVVSYGIVVKGQIQAAPEKTTPAREYDVGDKIPISLGDTLTFRGSRTLSGTTYTCVGSGECVVSYGLVVKGQIRVPAASPTTTRSATEINPEVLLGENQRPPMLWVDNGTIYALVGAEVQAFISGVEGAMNIAIGGNKVYWTEQTGENSGTINSANLDGSDVKELKAILAVPMGITVDTANNKLYWTNSRGRIQSLNADGSGRVENVMQNLSGPMDIAIGRSNLYWTEYDATAGTGSLGIANPAGRGTPKYISTGSDMPGSLTIAGNKVYWTEMTGESAGTLNVANLNGNDTTQLASIRAVPVGIAVDTARSKLYWTNSRGRIQSANLNGSKIANVVDGLGMPGDMVLSNSLKAPKATPTPPAANKYDVNGDGSVDNADVTAVALGVGTSNAKYDVNGDGTVDAKDITLVRENRDDGAAGAPMLVGMKLTAEQIGRLQAQIDLLVVSNDRSPATLKTLIYLQQLIAMARPEKTQLLANYPNPFNPETWMPYELATDTNVKITIYNAQGVVIRTLQLGQQSAGYYTDRERAAYWDGRNALGEQVASGIYFYQLETDEISSLRKMVILK